MPEPKKRKILIADDDPDVLILLERYLKKLQFPLMLVSDGSQALNALKATPEDFVLVILDDAMPHRSGLEVTHWMRMHPILASVPILMQTAKDTDEHRKEAQSKGVDTYLGKPYLGHELRAAVMDLIEPQS